MAFAQITLKIGWREARTLGYPDIVEPLARRRPRCHVRRIQVGNAGLTKLVSYDVPNTGPLLTIQVLKVGLSCGTFLRRSGVGDDTSTLAYFRLGRLTLGTAREAKRDKKVC
jgi:hypothetical protein